LLKELNRIFFKAVHASTLTVQQRKDALREISVMKEKHDRGIKGRTCTDGRSERGTYTKDQTASPTVSTDALMLPS